MKVGLSPLLPPVTVHGVLTVRRPTQCLTKAIHRPTPELIWSDGLIATKPAQTAVRVLPKPGQQFTGLEPPPPHKT